MLHPSCKLDGLWICVTLTSGNCNLLWLLEIVVRLDTTAGTVMIKSGVTTLNL